MLFISDDKYVGFTEYAEGFDWLRNHLFSVIFIFKIVWLGNVVNI